MQHALKTRGIYKILVEKLSGKKPLMSPKSRWDDNIKTDPRIRLWTYAV
jgi:hypothetical protein